jgi:hypothetical protein
MAQSRELEVRVQDRRVRRSNLMKHIARDDHELRCELDDFVQRTRKRLRHVCFALIDSARSQPLILAEAEVQVGQVDEAQTRSGDEGGDQSFRDR